MVRLASVRLAPYGRRTVVACADGFPHLPAAGQCVDRFVSTYVFDLLAPHEIQALLAEVQCIVSPGGRISLVQTWSVSPMAPHGLHGSLAGYGLAFTRAPLPGWRLSTTPDQQLL